MLKWKRIIKFRIYVHARIEIKSTYIMITQIYKNMCPLRTILLLYYHVSMWTVKYGQCSIKFSSTCDHTQFLFWLELLSFKFSMLCFYYSCLYIGCFFLFYCPGVVSLFSIDEFNYFIGIFRLSLKVLSNLTYVLSFKVDQTITYGKLPYPKTITLKF